MAKPFRKWQPVELWQARWRQMFRANRRPRAREWSGIGGYSLQAVDQSYIIRTSRVNTRFDNGLRASYTEAMSHALDGLLALWTTSEVADKIGCSPAEVSRWRGAHRRPLPARIKQIGDALAALRSDPKKPTNAEIAMARREVAEAVAADHASRRMAIR